MSDLSGATAFLRGAQDSLSQGDRWRDVVERKDASEEVPVYLLHTIWRQAIEMHHELETPAMLADSRYDTQKMKMI